MASRQSEAVADLYRRWVAAPAQRPDWSGDDQQQMVEDTWIGLTSEPRGVDYVEVDAGGRTALWAIPKDAPKSQVLFAVHGGGFISGSIYTHRKMYGHLAKAVGMRALLPSYRLVHEGGQFPAPAEDVLAAYRWLLDQELAPDQILFAGDSVGGNLALTVQLMARDRGLPLPAATLLFSPVTDFTRSGETMRSNEGKDALFQLSWLKEMDSAYLAGADPRDTYASPLHGNLAGLGPMLVQVGDQELLLDDSRQLAARAEADGVDVQLEIFPDQQHTFQMMAGRAPEADEAIARCATWARSKASPATPVLREPTPISIPAT